MPVNESNNEEEIVPEVPKLEMLIEDVSERGENEVIENEVLDEVPIDEDETVLKEEYVSKSEDNEIKGMVKGNIEWVSEILKSELSIKNKK